MSGEVVPIIKAMSFVIYNRFGRKRGYLLVLFLTSLATTALVWQPNIYVAIGLRAILGCVSGLVYNTAFVYGTQTLYMALRQS